MNWKVAIVVAALLFPLFAGADVYVKREMHTDGFYAGGSMNPPDDSTVEMWIGENRMAFMTNSMKCVIDAEKKTLVFVNRREKTFAETPLPLDMSKLFAEEDLGRLQIFKRTGSVKKSGKTKTVGEWKCTGYESHDWIDYEGGKVSERTSEQWFTTDVPFDLQKFNKLFTSMLTLANFSDDYMQQVSSISGFEVASTETRYQESVVVETTSKLVELVEKEPPPDAYATPEGCTRKDLLTLQDLRN